MIEDIHVPIRRLHRLRHHQVMVAALLEEAVRIDEHLQRTIGYMNV